MGEAVKTLTMPSGASHQWNTPKPIRSSESRGGYMEINPELLDFQVFGASKNGGNSETAGIVDGRRVGDQLEDV